MTVIVVTVFHLFSVKITMAAAAHDDMINETLTAAAGGEEEDGDGAEQGSFREIDCTFWKGGPSTPSKAGLYE